MHDSKVSWGNDERLQEKHCLFRDDFERGLRKTFECVSDFRTCFKNETPWTEVQGFFRACRLRRITYASLRAPFIPRLKSLGFSGRSYKESEIHLFDLQHKI
jgi:hypothetical protein